VGSFVRRVTTASGAIAVQIVHKRGRTVVGIDHVGSAHDEQRLALLLEAAKQRLRGDQQMLELSMPAPAPVEPSDPPVPAAAEPVVEATGSLILWEALVGIYASLGFGEIGDEAFRALVLGRIIEPTSKVDTIRVLDELGVGSPSLSTLRRCVKRTVERGYRATVAAACYRHATVTGGLGLALYDVTTLYFETPPRGRATQGRHEQRAPG
jgi:hypothetical protein